MARSVSTRDVTLWVIAGVSIGACRTADAETRETSARALLAHQVATISETPAPCSSCIRLGVGITIGDTAGPGELQQTRDIVRDSSGRYWVGQVGHLKVFDASGRFLRVVGRTGRGPLEFNWARPRFVDRLGRVHVFDRNQRATIVAPDFTYAGQYRVPGSAEGVLSVGDDEYLASMSLSSPSGAGAPLHLVKGDRVVRSFGSLETDGDVARNHLMNERRLAVSVGRRLFSVGKFSYNVGVWDSLGLRHVATARGPTLNERPLLLGPIDRDNPIPNEIHALSAPDETHLWVAMTRRRSNWLDHMEESVWPDGRRGVKLKSYASHDSVVSGRLDVVDTRAWRVVARLDSRLLFVGFLDDRTVIVQKYTSDGIPQLVMVPVTLRQP